MATTRPTVKRAVAMAGCVLDQTALIIAGMLVSASGGILTKLMADAMNRSITNSVVGGFGTGDSAPPEVGAGGAPSQVRSVSADDVAIQLAYARKVVFVPGHGLAAGRMPGHMNVLLRPVRGLASARRPSGPRAGPPGPCARRRRDSR
ncbi:NAD(P)(+) transhydrogenase (Re/Si-specific) subunit beta [Streptomyces sp. WI04-05B]|uniref:NAD(P)(+) transhydrogenase (Re/Si-specific) subunit beta n=1 Tax=Streptomyces TaxID=1883 RepID=UPI0029A5BD0E|nr:MULTISPECIES: NAD(P)(+) transhydrogenase (Re/Si-specific) subunit beta [unclassified Streptomyces]MDX2545127.1 NAD(P)(+) transhydrogenase (Re/Si-specific) subunit beta [Streptomyces sp. WI04-05B]MDX2587618.1 NAD(P)(+) transhydrogenase (Re/Si-specific) subunit beta [Streptomyces sp. WI04-05A]MDX3748202.1 NAD(P)(+) transhydrogenase (Re/Si-specific) subunit beta [Streptomyces sp. AK08-02]